MLDSGKIGFLDLEDLKRKPPSNVQQESGVKIYFRASKITKPPTEQIRIESGNKPDIEEIDIVDETIRLDEKEKVVPQKGVFTIRDERTLANFDRGKMLKMLNTRNIFSVKTLQSVAQIEKESNDDLLDTLHERSPDELEIISKTPAPEEIGTTFMVNATKEGRKEKEEAEPSDKPKIIRKKIVVAKKPKTFAEADIPKSELINEKMLPKSVVAHRVRASPYYMTNRKMYIQKLTPMFSKYKQILTDEARKASCDDPDGKSGNQSFKLLVHQQVVRDYLNLYTPYRGLLLYHGLGSGKTCSSIAIAEGMKAQRKVFVLTLASLKANFFEQMKVCGDPIYKLNQYWEFVSTDGEPELVAILSRALDLPMEFINAKKGSSNRPGAWMVNVTNKPNFEEYADIDKKSINAQIDEMIRSKYEDLNYNGGITKTKLSELTDDFTKNPFDNTVVIIDEVHNFVSRIVNKIKGKNKKSISYRLYEYLMSAENARIVLLSGTPIINYPNEIGILFNILRGYIKTWSFPIEPLKGGEKPSRDNVLSWFRSDNMHVHDYVQYSSDHITITRNPFGFVNTVQRNTGIKGGRAQTKRKNTAKPKRTTRKDDKYYRMEDGMILTGEKLEGSGLDETDEQRIERINALKTGGGAFEDYNGVELDETGNIRDEAFKQSVKKILERHGLRMNGNITTKNHLALPDTSKEFFNLFVGMEEKDMKNKAVFQKRVLGLSSYFRGADESLYPQFVPSDNGEVIHIENVPMSEYQFGVYDKIRDEESKREKKNQRAKQKQEQRGENAEEVFNVSSTYKIASRMACNFVFPNPPGRPVQESGYKEVDAEEEVAEEEEVGELNVRGKKRTGGENSKEEEEEDEEEEEEEEDDKKDEEEEEEEESDIQDADQEVEEKATKSTISYTGNYNKDIQLALMDLQMNAETYLTPAGLRTYSPKFLKILENVQRPEHEGLHMIYSQFRTLEGIGILKLVLEANGFAEFKIQKKGNEGDWEIVEDEKDKGKPKFALHTGTESDDEKKIILNIYNSKWKEVPNSIMNALQGEGKTSNKLGDVIKILMITASGAEGINLKNTRYVHLVEPYWHNVRTEQVIGRARRICSHQDLPAELRTVQVFLYITVLSDAQASDKKHIQLRLRDVSKLSNRMANESNENTRFGRYVRKLGVNPGVITTDQMLFEGAIRKEFVNNQILTAVKETAMDCQLYAGMNKDEPIVCYSYGVVKSNAFGSYPSLEQDIAEKDVVDVKERNIALVKITDPVTRLEYAMNPTTKELYDFEQAQRAKYTKEDLVVIGKIVKNKSGKEEIKKY